MAAEEFAIEGPLSANALVAATAALIANEPWADGDILRYSVLDNKLHPVPAPSSGLSFVSVNAPLTGDGTPGNPLGVSPASSIAAGSMSSADFTKLAALPSALALPVSVANGGTGSNTLTAHGVLLGNGTSAPTVAGPSASTGKVLTSHGASADPSFDDPITATNGTINLATANYTLTGLAADIGLDAALPSAGTYLIMVDLWTVINTGAPSSGDQFVYIRLYDNTAAAVVANSNRATGCIDAGGLSASFSSSFTFLVTIASTRTIKVQGFIDGSEDAHILSAGAGAQYTQLNWMKVG